MNQKQKHDKTQSQSHLPSHIFYATLLGVCVCCFCFVGSTWAWFTMKTQTNTTLESISYQFEELSIHHIEQSQTVPAENDQYELQKDSIYEITVKPNHVISTGYCCITNVDTKKQYYYLISQLDNEGKMTFRWNCTENGKYQVTAGWGIPTGVTVDSAFNETVTTRTEQ